MGARTEGIDGRVGWGRFTVFYIPLIPIHITGDDNAEVASQIQTALEKAGYSVTSAAPESERSGPVLRGDVETFWFNNYTWFFPIVPTWGNIDIKLRLESADGKSLWSRTFHGGGSTFNFFNGYTIAANEAMNQILNDMVTEFASEDLQRVLVGEMG